MNVKRLVYGLAVVIVLNIAWISPVAAKAPDVPTDHWAYYAVQTMLNKNYIPLLEDGTFQGSLPASRYTLADALSRMLDDLEASQVKAAGGDISSVVLKELDQAKQDLASWYGEADALKEELSFTLDSVVSLDERLSRVAAGLVQEKERAQDALAETKGALSEMEEALAEIDVNLDDIETIIGQIETLLPMYAEQIEEHGEALEANDGRWLELNAILKELEAQLGSQDKAIKSLENWTAEKSAVFAALQGADKDLREEIEGLNQRNQELEEDLENLASRLTGETGKRLALAAELAATQEDLGQARLEVIALQDKGDLLAELKTQLERDINAQTSSAMIREQRLERQIKDLQEEFAAYCETADKELKSAKSMSNVALGIAALGVIVGILGVVMQ